MDRLYVENEACRGWIGRKSVEKGENGGKCKISWWWRWNGGIGGMVEWVDWRIRGLAGLDSIDSAVTRLGPGSCQLNHTPNSPKTAD